MPGGQCHFTDSSSKGCWRDSALGRQELLQKFFRPVPLVLMKSKSLSWASHDCLRRCVSKAVRFSIIWHSVTRFSEKYLNLLEKGKVDFQAGSLTNNLYGGSDPGLAYAFSSLHEKDSTNHAIFHLGCPMNLWLSIHVVGSAVCSGIRYQKNIWFCSHNITAYLSFSDSLPSMWCWHPFFFFQMRYKEVKWWARDYTASESRSWGLGPGKLAWESGLLITVPLFMHVCGR